jgi:hypothetical protein
LGSGAVCHDDFLMRLEDQGREVSRQSLSIHVYRDLPAAGSAFAAEAARRQRHAPDAEELPESEGASLRRLDVDDAGGVVGVDRREEEALGSDSDSGGNRHAVTVDEEIEMDVKVEDGSLRGERRKPECVEARSQALDVLRPRRRARQLVQTAAQERGRMRPACRRADERENDQRRRDDS